MGHADGSEQWVRPVGFTSVSHEWVRVKCQMNGGDKQVALMGHADGSEQWVRLVGETSGSH